MHKIKINMLSNADKVRGQGVGSAYLEQVALVKNELSDYFDVVINDSKSADIIHCHTILPQYLMKMKRNKGINVAYVVLGVGQVQTRKGVKDFIEVAKKLPDITFVWAGGFSFGKITDGYEELKEIYENPPHNVHFIGIVPRESMNDIYNMADILFMPSYNELFPMSILEAINSQKPLLLRDLELYQDILFQKYLVADDNEGFIKNILKLKNDHQLYSQYQNYTYEISQYYSKEHVKEMWKEFYLDIAKKRIYK